MKNYVKGSLFKKEATAILCFLLFSLTSFAQADTHSPESKKPLIKSLIFPGWGQLSQKQYLKGSLFMASEVYCLIQFFRLNAKANDYYAHYRHAPNQDDAILYRQKTEQYDRVRNIHLLAGATVWIANMIDMFIGIKKKRNNGVSFYLTNTNNEKISVGINFYF